MARSSKTADRWERLAARQRKNRIDFAFRAREAAALGKHHFPKAAVLQRFYRRTVANGIAIYFCNEKQE